MKTRKIPKRISTAILNSLSAGVVPRIGLSYVAVGRKDEVEALLQDLESISEGGASFRFVVGRYGSGKSFTLQLLRNNAMERGFVVADADLSPVRRLVGSNRAGQGTYRELMRNLSTKTRPDGGALAAILERWISGVQASVVKEMGLRPNDEGFNDAVENKILEVVSNMEGLVHGFDFANVISTYWRGYRLDNDDMKDAALRWLRGEFSTKTEARRALGNVRVIVNDNDWYDYIKLMARFVADIGYKGLILLIDEAVNLYKISHSVSRNNNYEKLLSMFNDTMQGKASHLGILMGGTPLFVEDARRGLYSYEALRTRLATSRFSREGLKDTSGPIIRLHMLSHNEIFLLLRRLLEVHSTHNKYESPLTTEDLQAFMQEIVNRLGAEKLLTPREVVRDFISVLNLLQQNPDVTFGELIQAPDLQLLSTEEQLDTDVDRQAEFADFTL
ncbi:MAG: ATP-binding protein [Ardenticatenaceae bacterium]